MLKLSLWSNNQNRGLWKSGDEWDFSSGLSHSEFSSFLNTSYGYFPSSGMYYIIKIDIHSNWQNLYIGSLTFEVGKPNWKSLELPLPTKIIKKNIIPGGTEEISATIKDLKDVGAMIPTTLPFNLPTWPVQTTNGCWRIIVYHHKLNQVAAPFATAIPNAVLLFEQVAHFLVHMHLSWAGKCFFVDTC